VANHSLHGLRPKGARVRDGPGTTTNETRVVFHIFLVLSLCHPAYIFPKSGWRVLVDNGRIDE